MIGLIDEQKPKLSRKAVSRSGLDQNRDESLDALVKKAELFFDGVYSPPTKNELKALRNTLRITKAVAASTVDISLRTYTLRESGEGVSDMSEQEFALLVLFLLRATPYWSKVSPQCLNPIPAESLTISKKRPYSISPKSRHI